MVSNGAIAGSSLGSSVPAFTPHAISVSLPTWRDNVGYEEGEKRVIDAMVNGYPRFFLHLDIQKLARKCEAKFGQAGEQAMLFPTKKVAEHCRVFMHNRSALEGPAVSVRLIQLLICPEDNDKLVDADCGCSATTPNAASVDLHIALFPGTAFSIAKQFWQHTGMGISSRLAEHCLSMLPDDLIAPSSPTFAAKASNRHYGGGKGSAKSTKPPSPPGYSKKHAASNSVDRIENLNADHSVYLEERYGRNLPLTSAASAKRALRRRIAGVLVRDGPEDGPFAGDHDREVGPSSRGVAGVTESDVFLYPTGMAAIWNAHNLASSVRPPAKSVCFGFPYTDTLKIVQKWGPGCHFLGHGLDADIDELETILADESALNPDRLPALALFTEFPSNPLLRSANLPRLRALADKYDFLIVIDETLGNFVNVEILPYADIVVSSLTKVFSGDANVMGGSLVLNPNGRHYQALKAEMTATYEDYYFDQDALYMERNSRDFKRRIGVIDTNTETLCDYLLSHSLAGTANATATPTTPIIIKDVLYPKYSTRPNYQHCRISHKDKTDDDGTTTEHEGGFGGLFSLTFTSPLASQVFFDALACSKGPSLGTNFTLASPYTILAHFAELEWAARYGVEATLVRVSVGMEDTGKLLAAFGVALEAAEKAVLDSAV